MTALSELGRRTAAPPISWLMKLTLDRPELISLAAGFTDNESLPVAETRALLDEVLGSPKAGRPALQYGCTLGDPALRCLTAERLRALDGEGAAGLPSSAPYSPDRVVITSGSQQFLYMVTEALCDPGGRFLRVAEVGEYEAACQDRLKIARAIWIGGIVGTLDIARKRRGVDVHHHHHSGQ